MNWLAALKLQFLAPMLLASVPLVVGLLVYAYRRRGRGTRIVVPTLFILKEFQRISKARRTFVPPPRFYFELLLLLMICAALADLALNRTPDRIALVVDNSMSMGALSPERSGTTMLGIALDEAKAVINGAGASAQLEIFTTSPALRSRTGGFVAAAEALQVVNDVSITFAPDRLDMIAPQLLQEPRYDRVAFFSDREIVSARDDSSGRLMKRPRLSVDRPENIALIDLAALRTETAIEVQADVAAFARSNAYVKVRLDRVEFTDKGPVLQPLETKGLVIREGGRNRVSFSKVPLDVSVLQVTVAPDTQAVATTGDAIVVDNQGWLALRTKRSPLLLVSNFKPTAVGFEKIRSMTFDGMTPEQYAGASSTDLQQRYTAIVFHRFMPAVRPPLPSLVIAPPESADATVKEFVRGAFEITRWNNLHPALYYLNLPTLKITEATILVPPAWAAPLIHSDRGAIAYAGEQLGSPSLVYGFELLPYEGRSDPTLSILLLNALRVVAPESSDVGYRTIGGRLGFGSSSAGYQIFDGSGVVKIQGGVADPVATLPGVYFSQLGSGQLEIRAINYFDETESNTLRSSSLEVQPTSSIRPQEAQLFRLAPTIALLVAALLMADLMLTLWLKRRAKSVEVRSWSSIR